MKLEGLKVIDLSWFLPGPYLTLALADHGAEVIKVEPPGEGDPLRRWRKMHEGTSLWWYLQSRNKKSIAVNLKSPEGLDIVKQLAASADVVVENFRPGVLDRWGLGYPVLTARNPSLVMVSVSGFGATSPESQRQAYAPVLHAEAGLAGQILGGDKAVLAVRGRSRRASVSLHRLRRRQGGGRVGRG